MSTLIILICSYNSVRFVKDCLNSLASQEYGGAPFKVLFLDDGSRDDSFKIALSYVYVIPGLRILRNKNNKGLVYSCNKALKHIDTPYFMRLDTDDYLAKDAVSIIFDNLSCAKDNVFMVFNRWEVLKGKDKKINPSVTHDMFSWLAAGTVFNTLAVRGVGGYSDEYWEEYDLYLKLLRSGFKAKVYPHRIYFYRRGYGGMTGNLSEKKEGLKSLIDKWGSKVLNKYGNFKKFISYYGMRIG